MGTETPLHIAVGLDGAGWHPAAWREPDAVPRDLFTPGYWTRMIAEVEAGTLDFVTVEDALSIQSSRPDGPDERVDQVRGRLAATQIVARAAPVSRRVGLVPAVTVTYTEPFHTSRAIATLDFVSRGRAGWCAQVSTRPDESGHFDVRFRTGGSDGPVDLWREAADYIEVVRRLWDSWEDEAEIRDAATGRFLDADRLHRISFRGRWFSVAGPSVTPRPPQGQPLVCVPVRDPEAVRCAAAGADVVFVAPQNAAQARDLVGAVRAAQFAAGRDQYDVHVFADLAVVLEVDPGRVQARLARLDGHGGTLSSEVAVFVGTPADLADRLAAWQEAGLTGFRLRPAALPRDLRQITRELVPRLRSRGLFREEYEADTLRGLLGLSRPASRYATPTLARTT